ncbi:MAG: aminotransferase class IV family protein [Cyclobacteriaceae bacterium]|nr:aminotransferase class IV family protein [Cyclobacteriaceae bacterium]
MIYTYLNNSFVEEDKAFLHVSDLSIQRGYGIFDFFRVMDSYPLFIEDYLERLYVSAKEMHLNIPYEPAQLKEIIFELIRRNNLPLSGIKVILTGGYSPDGYQLADKANLIMLQKAMSFPSAEFPSEGIKIITHEYLRDKPHVKTINYVVGIWIQNKVLEKKAADVLYHYKDEVSEFPRCNFFIVKHDNTVVTPGDNILEGVTRKHVLKLAAQKYKVQIGTVTLDDVLQAREAFLTSTSKRIVPITQTDDHIIGDGKPGRVTAELFQDLVRLENVERAKALTK